MKVKELIKALKEFDPEDLVVLSVDEGNGHEEAKTIEAYSFLDRGIYPRGPLTQEMENNGYTEDEICKDGIPCIVIYP